MDAIVIRGAREHNLKNLSLTIPRNALVVLTGVSGSGKSSLAFDTLFAEGQRRYVESLSAYARQFLEQMEKPDVDSIEGLSPAISIEQKTTSKNPRSTVGTVTEIYDYLRLLYASIGKPHCASCGREIAAQTIQQMTDRILAMPEGTRFMLLAPFVRGKKGEYRKQMEEMVKQGFLRARVNGKMVDLESPPELDKQKKHTIEVIVDRLIVKRDDDTRRRLTDSLETATKVGKGLVTIATTATPGAKPDSPTSDETLSTSYACPDCGTSLTEITPRLFSFNSPFGACPTCSGLGTVQKVDPDRLIPDPSKSIREGAIVLYKQGSANWRLRQIEHLAKVMKFSLDVPFKKLGKDVQEVILHGSGAKEIKWKWKSEKGEYNWSSAFKGLVPLLEGKYKEVESEEARAELENYMSASPCPACKGRRLKPEALSVLVDGRAIDTLTALTLEDAQAFFGKLEPTARELEIAGKILKEIGDRLGFLNDVGIGYLSLARASATLSGGEAQRIRLATQIGSKLMGVLYVLDEPSIGLHAKDNRKLIDTLFAMRDLGNTVVVVEHDDDGVPEIAHREERVDELPVVLRVEADRRLVEDVEDSHELAADLRREADALRLATRKGRGRASEREVPDPDVVQETEAVPDLLQDLPGDLQLAGRRPERVEERLCVLERERRERVDGASVHEHGQRLGLQPPALARRAGRGRHVVLELGPCLFALDLLVFALEERHEALEGRRPVVLALLGLPLPLDLFRARTVEDDVLHVLAELLERHVERELHHLRKVLDLPQPPVRRTLLVEHDRALADRLRRVGDQPVRIHFLHRAEAA